MYWGIISAWHLPPAVGPGPTVNGTGHGAILCVWCLPPGAGLAAPAQNRAWKPPPDLKSFKSETLPEKVIDLKDFES